ncbi:hypothetical protein GALMADRAFT_1242926 [Galerina marginata CBS 339.88]|uniref:Uncharacterized protein n=1 Tax=Galerina marginata (strain CBS 339.88) TaxID=685588 RepID=A0A067T8Q6_GALM3|nr:hypothetical protein GALMADRAFT_1242926 [Galerina marginata CBS 339.88]
MGRKRSLQVSLSGTFSDFRPRPMLPRRPLEMATKIASAASNPPYPFLNTSTPTCRTYLIRFDLHDFLFYHLVENGQRWAGTATCGRSQTRAVYMLIIEVITEGR